LAASVLAGFSRKDKRRRWPVWRGISRSSLATAIAAVTAPFLCDLCYSHAINFIFTFAFFSARFRCIVHSHCISLRTTAFFLPFVRFVFFPIRCLRNFYIVIIVVSVLALLVISALNLVFLVAFFVTVLIFICHILRNRFTSEGFFLVGFDLSRRAVPAAGNLSSCVEFRHAKGTHSKQILAHARLGQKALHTCGFFVNFFITVIIVIIIIVVVVLLFLLIMVTSSTCFASAFIFIRSILFFTSSSLDSFASVRKVIILVFTFFFFFLRHNATEARHFFVQLIH
jgi:hypothetical protein